MQNKFLDLGPISFEKIELASKEWLKSYSGPLEKVLIVPPDGTRSHSLAGPITAILYHILQPSEVKILPALGTHVPMTKAEKEEIFGASIPDSAYIDHNWRTDVESVGEIPREFVREVSEGRLDFSIDLKINKELTSGKYDLIISVGQVVPHEVVGMANYTKNIVVGCGGKDIIDKSHYLGAVYGMEKMMGRDHSPVRKVFDYAEEKLLAELPLTYVLTVTKTKGENTTLEGLYLGRERKLFEKAVKKSRETNLDLLEKPLKKVVVYLDPKEFRTTWLGNKSVYRTRMAIADGGELIILAPGVQGFGEDQEIDRLIRQYGYKTGEEILRFVEIDQELRDSLSVAAHLVHGSSNDRFKISYAVSKLSKEEIEAVNYNYLSYEETIKTYNPKELVDGFNEIDGEEIFYISNPALGLWALTKDF